MSYENTRKLIEVALPLTEISKASVREKRRSVGTIKNVHKWFAPMPTPALRALIFAALVNDPGDEAGRAELIELIKQLVPQDGTIPKQKILKEVMNRIAMDNPELPTVLDPFAGGGSTLVEAQRLGLPTIGSDLNPVAVLITRVLGELLPPVAKVPAVSSEGGYQDIAYEGLAADVRYYGQLVQQAVERRLGGLYAKPRQGELVASLWARTVPCPNPACGVTVPLFSSPWLSKQKGREATVEPVVDHDRIRFVIHRGKDAPARSTKLPGKAKFECPACRRSFGEKELRAAGNAGNMGLQLMAVCIDLPYGGGRSFLGSDEMGEADQVSIPDDVDEIEIGDNRKNFATPLYGLPRHVDLYTPRQLAVLAAFADEISGVRDRVKADGGSEAQANAIASVLALCLGKFAQSNSSLVRWYIREGPSRCMPAFGTQAMPMLWDFAEANPFGHSVGSWTTQVDSVIAVLRNLPTNASTGRVVQADARSAGGLVPNSSALLITDPPYFAQINYADLSDYFYLWIRRAIRDIHPDLFSTMATPKFEELVANPSRHNGSKDAARKYFIEGFTQVFSSLLAASRSDLPLVIAYAHKQDEETVEGISSSGWESLLEAILAAGLAVVRTWPIEATHDSRAISQGVNALASYVILVCKPRQIGAGSIDRAGFLHRLSEELPAAINELKEGGIAAVDLRQAAGGPGMRVFSEYDRVIENDGERMPVRTALALISDRLDVVLREQEGNFDRETRWCVAWFDENGWDVGRYGRAEQLSNSYNISMDVLERAGVLRKGAGSVYLIKPEDLPKNYDPIHDERPTVWEAALHMSRLLEEKGVDAGGQLMTALERRIDVDAAKDLAYLLFNVCERKSWAKHALRFNNLVTSWPDLVAAAQTVPALSVSGQGELDFSDE